MMPYPYAEAEGKTRTELKDLLQEVFDKYKEHQRRGFDGMVALFAEDDFYNLHYVAIRYLESE